MKCLRTGFLILFLLVFARETTAHSPHDFIRAVAVSPDYHNDQTVFCSLSHMDNFILKSTDEGSTWVPSQIGFPHYAITCIHISPGFQNDDTIFLGCTKGGVYVSHDRGRTWNTANEGLANLRVNALALSPFFVLDETLFAATDGRGVFKSTDGGASWQQCLSGLIAPTVNDLAISPSFPVDRTLFCCSENGLFKSINAGTTWFEPNTNLSGTWIQSVACSPKFAKDQIVVLGTWGEGFLKSKTGGEHWIQRNDGINDLNIVNVAFSPDFANDYSIFISTKEDVYKSVNGGNQWTLAVNGLMEKVPLQTDTHYFDIGFSSNYAVDQTLFLGTWEGLHRSSNAADLWTQMNVYNQNFIRAMTISPDFGEDGTVFGGAYGGGVYRSTDYGESWIPNSTGVSSMHIASMQASPDFAHDQTVFAGIFPDVIKTTIGGMAWYDLEVDPSNFLYVRAMVISPNFKSDQTLFAGNDKNGIFKIYKTTDGGTSFTGYAADFEISYCFAISPDFFEDRTLFTGTDAGLFKSTDDGKNWMRLAFGGEKIFSLAISPEYSQDGVIFAGVVNNGAYMSADRGKSWVFIDNGFDQLVAEGLFISPDFAQDGTVFTASKSRGMFKSTDRGATWFYAGLWGKFLRSGVISPCYSKDQTLFVGGWGQIYRTTDGSLNWQKMLHNQRYDDSNEFVIYDEFWSNLNEPLASGGSLTISNEPLATATFDFIGDGVAWTGVKTHNAGRAEVYIDDVLDDLVDLYSATTELEALIYYKKGLDYGNHTIKIVATGTHHPLSQGAIVIIDALDVKY